MLLGKEYHWLTVSECLHLNYLYAIGSRMSLPAPFVKQKHVIMDAWVWAGISLSFRRQTQNLSGELVVWCCFKRKDFPLWVCGWARESQIWHSCPSASPCYNQQNCLWVSDNIFLQSQDLGYVIGQAVIVGITPEIGMPTPLPSLFLLWITFLIGCCVGGGRVNSVRFTYKCVCLLHIHHPFPLICFN